MLVSYFFFCSLPASLWSSLPVAGAMWPQACKRDENEIHNAIYIRHTYNLSNDRVRNSKKCLLYKICAIKTEKLFYCHPLMIIMFDYPSLIALRVSYIVKGQGSQFFLKLLSLWFWLFAPILTNVISVKLIIIAFALVAHNFVHALRRTADHSK